ncbi:L,D-transpeptidase family protein [Methyloglobulus sp.]|uniref:L,D-transpeptidase family protein n=1 Tax=Methyloglobulus sp. TaxID=2518622 RepID=UPI003989F6DC
MIQQAKFFASKWLILFLATLPLQHLFADGSALQEPSVSKEINAIITARRHPYLKQANFSNRIEDLDALYKRANYKLLWLGDDATTAKNTADALELLANASSQGLIQENYDAEMLRKKFNLALTLTPTAYKELALYDTALSIAVLRFLHDIHYGRVNPHGINFNLQLREKKLTDFPVLIKDSMSLNTISQLPLLVEPKLQQYQKLKSALATYRLITAKSPSFKFIVKGKLRPGEHHPQLAELNIFLAGVGDLPESATINSAEKNPKYTDNIVEGVKKFQIRHGLAADGTIGPATATAINEPLAQRITQIELAMERLRWLPELNVGRSIIVNIPAFQLWAIDDINDTDPNIINMRVVVGKALKNQTPVLMAQMSFIEFMPYWNVPANILKGEILPKLIRNPDYLFSQNMEIVPSSGHSATPVSVNNDTIEKLKRGVLRVRQRPGNKNSLGKVKFIFPNKDDVYLHDTPANSLFSKSRRDFSHGCVRVENPIALTEFALRNQGKWDSDTIKKAMKSPITRRVILQQPIPVLFFYTTSFIDQNNNLAFYQDIYGHDAVLLEALKKNNDLSDQSIFVSARVEPPVPNGIP